MKVSTRSEYTFKHNRSKQRHGWLRLTPAYSVRLVEELVSHLPVTARVLDPFAGTATTGLACAERGISCDLSDINPFLVWFGNLKTSRFTESEILEGRQVLRRIEARFQKGGKKSDWLPPIFNIERWWPAETLSGLGRLRALLVEEVGEPLETVGASGVLWVAFARVVIEHSAAAFNHVSVSFKNVTATSGAELGLAFSTFAEAFLDDAASHLPGEAVVRLKDSRNAGDCAKQLYDAVITSPPYPNRISYIRELRPYMYWLRFLSTGKMAGELDWEAIGGTWGIATSRLNGWSNENGVELTAVEEVATRIQASGEKHSVLMAQYVRKYFYDMHEHFQSLRGVMRPGAELHYIIGNSSFYGIVVHAEKLMEESLRSLGFASLESRIVRKRNSKKELYEFCLSARFG